MYLKCNIDNRDVLGLVLVGLGGLAAFLVPVNAFMAFISDIVRFGTCYEVEKSIILTIMVRKLVISVTSGKIRTFLAFIRP